MRGQKTGKRTAPYSIATDSEIDGQGRGNESSGYMGYDIMGDIHGQADKLLALLSRLGYREGARAYRHPNRMAVFVGDFIDRGPHQLSAVSTVRRMVDCGSALAVMGNHEFNAIAWHMPDPDRPREFLRPHHGEIGRKNREQHGAFLAAVEKDPALHSEIIHWFLTLPLWLDLPSAWCMPVGTTSTWRSCAPD